MRKIKEIIEEEADSVAVDLLRDSRVQEGLELDGETYWKVQRIIKHLIISFYEDTP